MTEMELYVALCRGDRLPVEFSHPDRVQVCRVVNFGGQPTHVLAPAHIEILLDDPPIFLLHDVILDNEIEHIKRLATPTVFVLSFIKIN